MKRHLLSLLTAACLGTFLASSAMAQTLVPALINYQAYVTDNTGKAYGSASDGSAVPTNYDVEFRIYNAATTPAVVWAEKQTVTISQGRFSVLLGNGAAIGSSPRPNLDTLFGAAPATTAANTNLSVGITVNAVGATSGTEFTPRQQLVSNPLALRAKSAAVADSVLASSILAASIATDTITAANLAASSVTSSELADNAVGNAEMADNAIGNLEMADNAIGNLEMADNAIGNAEMANNAIGNAEMADNAVGNAEMADNAVGTNEVINNSLSAMDVDFAYADSSSIWFHHPTPLSGRYPSLQIQNDTTYGGLFYFHVFRAASHHQATLWFDDGGFLALRRDTTDGGHARLDSTGTWSKSSDKRLKKDITPAGEGLLAKSLQIEPVHYRFKSEDQNQEPHFGVIAQNIDEVIPELVTKGDTWGVDYSSLSVVAIGAIKEQHAIVEDQGGRIGSLEKENTDLKARLERLEKVLGAIK